MCAQSVCAKIQYAADICLNPGRSFQTSVHVESDVSRNQSRYVVFCHLCRRLGINVLCVTAATGLLIHVLRGGQQEVAVDSLSQW